MDKETRHTIRDTQTVEYTEWLIEKQERWWKRLFDVQAPYRWNIQRLGPGVTLDIGCGIGRNLLHLHAQGVGIDHNACSVEAARRRGLVAFTPEEFRISEFNSPEQFDSLLLGHVAEHMRHSQVIELLNRYMHVLKPAGKLIMIAPQEAGYRSDESHVEFMDFFKLRTINDRLGFRTVSEYSFPFPRRFGRFFPYNEFVVVGVRG